MIEGEVHEQIAALRQLLRAGDDRARSATVHQRVQSVHFRQLQRVDRHGGPGRIRHDRLRTVAVAEQIRVELRALAAVRTRAAEESAGGRGTETECRRGAAACEPENGRLGRVER